eukprot:Tamp_36071.p1 GENE.Tamp_36071~~Tamp_36071.p1  ORF type:complete len:141 (+),score=15.02 Tamp_36071:107-529(+)
MTAEKEAIVAMVTEGTVEAVHKSKFARAHGPTDYTRWLTATSEYAVAYESEYEPYILCRRDVAPLDLRFVGYGGDKTSHIYELSRGGHVLVVVPQAFVVHEHHAAGLWASGQNWTRTWMDWTTFVEDTNEMYTPQVPYVS